MGDFNNTAENQDDLLDDPALRSEDQDTDTGGDGSGRVSGKDSGLDSRALQAELKKTQEDRESFKKDLEAHKQELAAIREHNRRVGTALSGLDKSPEEMARDNKAKQVRDAMRQMYPWFDKAEKMFAQSEGGQQTEQPRSLAEQHYFNQARQTAFDRAAKMGFQTREGQEAVVSLGDLLIHQVKPWKDRFYGQGDHSVLEEVTSFLEKKVFGPYAKNIEARFLDKLRRQGLLLRMPNVPVEEPKSGKKEKKADKEREPDYSDPNERLGAMTRIAEEAMRGGEE